MFGPLPPPSRTIPVWASIGSPDTQVSPEMKKRIYLPKLVPLCPMMRFQALSPQLVPKSVIANTAIGDVTSHTPIWTSKSLKSLWRLLLSRSIRNELSRLRCHGHSLLLSSYLHRISRKENSDCSACGHPLQDLNHLLLDCRASEPLRKSIFGSSLSILVYGPDLGVWPDCWVSAEFLRSPIPRKGSGSTTTTVINRCQFISECESSSPKIVTRLVDFLTETSASFIPFQITLFLFVAIINWLPSFQ